MTQIYIHTDRETRFVKTDVEETRLNWWRERDDKMQDLSSTVSNSPSFSYYASGEFAAAAVKVSRENQSFNITDHQSVKVDSFNDEDADFEFETSPLHEEAFVPFPTFKTDVVSVINKKDKEAAPENISDRFSGNCLWTPLRSPAASKHSESSTITPKRCRLKKFLTRSHSDGGVLAPSASKRCYIFKDLMRRSHSDPSKTSSPAVKVKDKTVSYKVGEGDKRRKSYLPYRQDLIGVFAVVRGLRR